MSHLSAFSPLRGNQETKPFRVYLDCLVVEDMHFNSYIDHSEMRSCDDILLYSGWVTCGSQLTFPHLPKRVMRQLRFTQSIPRHPVVSAPPTMTRRVMDVMFDDYLSHMVPEETQSIIAESD